MGWQLGPLEFSNRLILGTGKYPSFDVMQACHQAAEVEMITLAVRRFDLSAEGKTNILHWIPPIYVFFLIQPDVITLKMLCVWHD